MVCLILDFQERITTKALTLTENGECFYHITRSSFRDEKFINYIYTDMSAAVNCIFKTNRILIKKRLSLIINDFNTTWRILKSSRIVKRRHGRY